MYCEVYYKSQLRLDNQHERLDQKNRYLLKKQSKKGKKSESQIDSSHQTEVEKITYIIYRQLN